MEQLSTLSSLYVGDLHPDVTESILFDLFRPFGSIHSVHVCRDVASGRSLGYAYVNFLQRPDAEEALDTMMFAVVMGQPMRIMWSQRNPSLRKSGVGNIIIKNLDRSIDSMALYDTFSAFGSILSCKVMCDENGSKGYGFVHFESLEAADRAIRKLNGMLLNDSKVFMEHFKSFKVREAEKTARANEFNNIYIKNFGVDMDDDRLMKLFSVFGPVLSARVMTDENRTSKGFGFVSFLRAEDAQRAVDKINGWILNGKVLYVGRVQSKNERELKQKFEQTNEKLMAKCQDDGMVETKAHPSNKDMQKAQSMCAVSTAEPSSCQVSQSIEEHQVQPSNKSMQRVMSVHATPKPAVNPYQAAVHVQAQEALTASVLADVPPQEQKQMLSEHLFRLIKKIQPTQVGKITDLLLQLNTSKLLHILNCPESLSAMVDDAAAVLEFVEMKEASQMSGSSAAVKGPVLNENRTSKGFGFVSFLRAEDSQRAVDKINGRILNGNALHVRTELKQKFEQTNEKLMAKCQDDRMVETKAHPSNKDMQKAQSMCALSSAEPSSCQVSQSSEEHQVQPSNKSMQRVMSVHATPKPAVNPYQAAVHVQAQEALTASVLADVPPQEQKQMLGERLFPLIKKIQPTQTCCCSSKLKAATHTRLSRVSELHGTNTHTEQKIQKAAIIVNDAVAVLQFVEIKEASQKSGSSTAVKETSVQLKRPLNEHNKRKI